MHILSATQIYLYNGIVHKKIANASSMYCEAIFCSEAKSRVCTNQHYQMSTVCLLLAHIIFVLSELVFPQFLAVILSALNRKQQELRLALACSAVPSMFLPRRVCFKSYSIAWRVTF